MNMSYRPTTRAQGGFTLIELIVVIVILGILAATALPKFADLGGDARKSTVMAARGSLESVSAMVHGKALINGNDTAVVMEGTSVAVSNGYPDAVPALVTAAGLGNTNDWVQVATGAATATSPAATANDVVVVPKSVSGLAASVTCYVKYTKASASSATPPVITPPSITTDVSGC